MRTGNDMYVDYDELCIMETKLAVIRQALYESNSLMSQELIESQNYLEGQQFEKAKAATFRCIQLSGRICGEISPSVYLRSRRLRSLPERGKDRGRISGSRLPFL